MAKTAEMVTAALGGRWHAGRGMCRCVVHNDKTPSLSVRDGDVDGRILVKCFAGCDARDILDVLRRRGILPSEMPRMHHNLTRTRACGREHIPNATALGLWRSAQLAKGSLVGKYLLGRGITIPIPPSIRCGQRQHSGTLEPTMIVAVQAPDGALISAGTVSRINTGSLGAGAVRLAKAGEVLGLAEGVESALSAMQLHGVPCWASLGAARLALVAIPDHVRELVVFADNDQPGRAAAERVVSEQSNRRAVVEYPLNGTDWNDHLNEMCL